MSLRKHFYPIKDKKISGALKAKRERPKSKKTSHSQCTTCTYYIHFTTTLHTFTKKNESGEIYVPWKITASGLPSIFEIVFVRPAILLAIKLFFYKWAICGGIIQRIGFIMNPTSLKYITAFTFSMHNKREQQQQQFSTNCKRIHRVRDTDREIK